MSAVEEKDAGEAGRVPVPARHTGTPGDVPRQGWMCTILFLSLFRKMSQLMYTDQTGVAKALHVFVKYNEDEIVL
jgi:hypothetical protein